MKGVLEYLERIALRMPQKTAIAYREEAYTFAELRTAAARLGAAIQDRAGSRAAVAVLVNRDADTAAAFLGVLYSGNYYVPLDPDMPVTKLRTILEDSGAGLLLGKRENATLAEQLGMADRFLMLTEAGMAQASAPETEADTPMYMVYTSGSTGKPKGVLKSHGAVMDFIEAYAETFALGSEEVIGNQTPFFFDASAKDLYLMLYTGATLEVLPSELFIFPVTLVQYMNERGITYICWVPTALAIITQLNTFRKLLPQTLKNVFFVGEVFPLKQLKKWLAALPQLRYVNLYGSSELAGICCWYEIDSAAAETLTCLPMGKPLCNSRVFLQGEDGIVSEAGQLGEVCVASAALALEYFHDPEKTQRSFCTARLSDGTTARVLKTGDLARYDAEGNLVFVSRKDYQIKHMGRRIELGEIESVADRLAEVQRCCCLYDEARKRIVLFCELASGCRLDGQAVQSALRGNLSDYMLPSKVVVLEKMPLNANGKIDRTKLKEIL